MGLETRPRSQDLLRRLFWITAVEALIRDLGRRESDPGKIQKLDQVRGLLETDAEKWRAM